VSGRKSLVTGGAGFIGAHLVDRLVEEGWSVRVLDDFSSGRQENLECARGRGVEVVCGDVRDPEAVAKAVEGVDVVFHQAAIPSVPRSVSDPLTTHSVNVGGTVQVLESARRAGVRRVIHASSSSVYGDSNALPRHEDMPADPRSPYALQKHSGELYCRLYTELHGLETVSLRYFNVFGTRQDPRSAYAAVVPRFLCAALAGRPATIYGDGEQTRDFTFVADAVRANLLAADAPRAVGAVVNVGSGIRTPLNALWDHIREMIGTGLVARYEAARPGEVRDSLADLSRAGELLGYRNPVDLREGLRRTVAGFRPAAAGR
jgi:nucleoside-diphosphate-sugar epimerase